MLSAFAAAALVSPWVAHAQEATPLRILVGFPPGGSTDAIARNLAVAMQNVLGRPVVVDNRAGAGGQIAAQVLKAAKPDGNTLFLSNSHTVSMIPLTVKSPGFDTTKDFVPVGLVAINPDVFAISTTAVGASVTGLKDYAAWAKANAGKGNVGVPAPASAPDFAVGTIAKALGTDLKSAPYRGDGPVAQDLVGGQISGGIGSVGAMLPQVATGKIRIVAVNGRARLAALPEVPTYAELGIKGLEDVIFTAMFAPAGTPPDLVRRYNAAINQAVASPELREKLSNLGITLMGSTPEQLAQRVQDTTTSWAEIVKQAGFQPQ